MSHTLIKMLLKGTVKLLPKWLEKYGNTEILVSELTIDELVEMFRANPNKPKCFITTTPLSSEQVFANCQDRFINLKAHIATAQTKDGWHILLAEKEKSLWGWGFDVHASQHLLAVSENLSGVRSVIIGFFLTDTTKIDLFGILSRGANDQILKIANLIQPNSGLKNLYS